MIVRPADDLVELYALERRREQIVLNQSDPPLQSGGSNCGARLGDALRVALDPGAARAALRGGDQDAPVAAAEIEKVIVGPDLGEEHARFDGVAVGLGPAVGLAFADR